MRVVLFLSRFTFICNISFLLFVFFRWLEAGKPPTQADGRLIWPGFLKETIIILGFTAIIINLLMNIVYLIFMLTGNKKKLPLRLVISNFIFLILQIYYFFL